MSTHAQHKGQKMSLKYKYSFAAPAMTSQDVAMWGCARSQKKTLIDDGWHSPDTYGKCFKPFVDNSAVYLFLLHEAEMYDKAIVAYVGMSTHLSQRMCGHNVLPLLRKSGYWPMRWFKPVSESDLRKVEAEIIDQYSPPWNIQGRSKGVILS